MTQSPTTQQTDRERALELWRKVEWHGNSFTVASALDAQFYAELNNAIEAALTAPTTPTDERVMEAVKNLRDLMKHGSANGAIEVWVQYDHPVKLAGLSHVDCENLIRAATSPKQDDIADRLAVDLDAAHDMIRCLIPLAKGYVAANSGIRSTECIIEDAEAMKAAYEKQKGRW